MLTALKDEVCDANRRLPVSGLVHLTWGNVSAIDRVRGVIGIKPSGLEYRHLTPGDIVILDLEGSVVEGRLSPSSDTRTHLELYRAWPDINGICHTHSPAATAFAQAGVPIPCYGTTHADHFHGSIPLCRSLTPEETEEDYERHTGLAIVSHFDENNLDPVAMPGVLQLHHAPFTWGRSALSALDNSIAMETIAQMALHTLQLNPDTPPIPDYLLQKHYGRKHGPNAYYGQGRGDNTRP